MSVTITSADYGPSAYVHRNYSQIFSNYIMNLDTDPGTIQFRIDWIRSNGNIWLTIGPQTIPTTGLTTQISSVFTPPGPLPQGGIRPQLTVDAGPAGTVTFQFCTGITPVPPKEPKCDCPDQCPKP